MLHVFNADFYRPAPVVFVAAFRLIRMISVGGSLPRANQFQQTLAPFVERFFSLAAAATGLFLDAHTI